MLRREFDVYLGSEIYGGQFSISLVDSQEYAYYTIRTLQIERLDHSSRPASSKHQVFDNRKEPILSSFLA